MHSEKGEQVLRFWSRVGLVAALAIVVAVACATTQAGAAVGYTPTNPVSKYKLDTLDAPYQAHRMDLSADPGAVGAVPNPYYLNLGDPAVRIAFERRYGPNTAGTRFKRWLGPGNEVKSIVADALSWKFGGGRPSEVEITDAQATSEVWSEYLMATAPGFSPERRIAVNDPKRPFGNIDSISEFWGIPYYEFNVGGPIEPPPPPEDPPVDPPCEVCPTCPTLPPLSAAEQRAEEIGVLLRPIHQVFAKHSYWRKKLPPWSELWAASKPLVVEILLAKRRFELRAAGER